jgi:hypothetical protein
MPGSSDSALRVGQPRPVEVGPDLKRLRNYAAGCLSDHDRLELEERMRHDPVLVEELEQLMRFREGLQVVKDEGYFRAAAPQPKRPSAWGLKPWLPYLVAAAIAGVALVLWQSHIPDSGPLLTASLSKDRAGVSVPVALHTGFVSLRGAEAPPEFYPPAHGPIEFAVRREEAPPNARFRFTLTRTDDDPTKELGSIAGLTLGPDHFIHAYAEAARLSPGSYVLRVEPEGSPAQAETFSFNFRTR